MIQYTKFQLENGLTVIHHPDESTQLAVLNLVYNVGSKHENPEKTGFAHLFEHLMFGGSLNIEDFDGELQKAGGESNAFTSNDITNYYLTLPATNIETGFWLESDRMLSLDFNQESLDIQRNVVIEEFKERYLNQPYGDVWLHILPLAYRIHPYSWPTIGKDISHIEQASLEDVKGFFSRFYVPNNACLVVAGKISLGRCRELCNKWFGPIPKGKENKIEYCQEPEQNEAKTKTITANVPFDLIVKAWHMPARTDSAYYASDLLTDILGSGRSSRLYNELVKKRALFSELDAYITGDVEAGLLLIEGKLIRGVSMEQAEAAIMEELEKIKSHGPSPDELSRVINKSEANISFNDVTVLNRAMKLAYGFILGDAELVNKEASLYARVSASEITQMANTILQDKNCSTLYYLSKNES